MTGLVLRRTALEVWDIGVVAFCLNLALVAWLLIAALLVRPLAAQPLLLAAFLPGAAAAFFILAGLAAAVFDDVARQREFSAARLRRTAGGAIVASLLLVPPLFGLCAMIALKLSIPAEGAAGVAMVVGALWFGVIVFQLAVATLAAIGAGDDLPSGLARAARFCFGHPFAALLLSLTGLGLCLVTLGMYPGFIGMIRLFQNGLRLDQFGQTALAAERASLARRGAGTILFPWRMR